MVKYHNMFQLLLLLLLLLFNFQFYFWFLTILHRVFTQDLGWGKVVIICILCIYCFWHCFWVIFSVALIVSSQGDEQFCKVQFFVFHISWYWLLFHSLWVMVFHWGLIDSKSLQVFRTLLSILANLNNAVVCIGLILFLISNSFSLFFQTNRDCSKCSKYNWYDWPLHVSQLFQFTSKIQVLVNHFAFFHFHTVVSQNNKIHSMTCSFLLTNKSRSSLHWFVCISKS